MEHEELNKKVWEVIRKYNNTLYVYWDEKILSINDWMIILRDKTHKIVCDEELHLEECTLSDLKENDVFVYTNTYCHPGIVFDVTGNSVWFYYLYNDVIQADYNNKIDLKVIKILN